MRNTASDTGRFLPAEMSNYLTVDEIADYLIAGDKTFDIQYASGLKYQAFYSRMKKSILKMAGIEVNGIAEVKATNIAGTGVIRKFLKRNRKPCTRHRIARAAPDAPWVADRRFGAAVVIAEGDTPGRAAQAVRDTIAAMKIERLKQVRNVQIERGDHDQDNEN